MKKSSSVWLLIVSVCFTLGCSKSSSPETKKCGAPINNFKSIEVSSTPIIFDQAQWNENNVFTSLSGNERSFTIMLKQDDLCGEQPVTLNYSVTTTGLTGVAIAIDMLGQAQWGETQSKEIYFCKKQEGNTKANYEYKTAMSADIKSDFPSSPGNIKSTLKISFYTLGSETLDTSYFRSKFKTISMNISGNKY